MSRRPAKRVIDLVVALIGLVVCAPLVVLLVVVATVDCRTFGLFAQSRVGRGGETFTVFKVRTMRTSGVAQSPVTVRNDARITRTGRWMRRWKLDELPQLWNVVAGQMSLVGPRPDVVGYADDLSGDDRVVLELRPGITGPATLVFRDEELLLAGFEDPVAYNDQVIWPAKVAVNRAYAAHARLRDDVALVRMTLVRDNAKLARVLAGWSPTLLRIEAVAAALGEAIPDGPARMHG